MLGRLRAVKITISRSARSCLEYLEQTKLGIGTVIIEKDSKSNELFTKFQIEGDFWSKYYHRDRRAHETNLKKINQIEKSRIERLDLLTWNEETDG